MGIVHPKMDELVMFEHSEISSVTISVIQTSPHVPFDFHWT